MPNVTLADIDDIISRCKAILNDHNLAATLLPAKGMELDPLYFCRVKDCLQQMQQFRKAMKKERGGAFVIFSK